MPAMVLLPGPDTAEFGQRSFKFVVEEPHRIEDFAESCKCLGSRSARPYARMLLFRRYPMILGSEIL
jgi:hypothetical protein